MEIVIVGAEIGGLAAAHLLGRGGHRVTVVGEAGRLRTSGAAVSLWFSGATVLPRLTVGAETTGAPTGRLLQGSTDGRIMFDLDASRLAARFGASSLLSPRADGWFLRRAALPSPVLTSVFGTYLRGKQHPLGGPSCPTTTCSTSPAGSRSSPGRAAGWARSLPR